jgi:putative ABC transport system permease protein
MFEAEIARVDPAGLKENDQNRPRLIPLRERLAGQIRDALWALTGLVGFVLLAASANVGQLLLSRASERREEFAMRAALGASRARLVQQLTTEALVLTVSAAVIGLVVAHQVCRMAVLVAPGQLATQEYSILDWHVVSFAAILAVLIGLIFGILPVFTTWHRTEQTLRSQTATGGRGAMRIRWGLVAIQAGLTLTLAAGSLAMGRSFLRLLETDLGFNPTNAVTLNVSLHGTSHDHSGRQRSFYQEALDRLRAAAVVQAAGAVSYLPLANQAFMAGSFKLDSGQELNGIVVNSASPDYFRAIGTPFLSGRDFRTGEREPVVIVNEAFAQLTGLGRHVVGRSLTGSWTSEPYEVVGVVQTTRFAGPSYPGTAMIYWRVDEEPPPALTLIARVNGDAKAAIAVCRDAVRAVDPAVPVYDVKTFEQRLADTLAKPKFYTESMLFLGGLAVLVAVAGIYGSAARSVAQRKREMGVRIAIGATRWQLRALIVRELLLPVTIGAGAGIGGALVTGRYVEHLIANAEPVALQTCVAAAGLLVAITGAAAWIATSRILSINPSECVRSE